MEFASRPIVTAAVLAAALALPGTAAPDETAAALARLLGAAQAGDTAAQNDLGVRYERGDGVERDPAAAERWYAAAAARGNGHAAFNLALLYGLDEGIPQAGVDEALYRIGRRFDRGADVARDYAEARRWYERAAALGHPKAQYNLGVMCEQGQGAPRDPARAVYWYLQAAERGLADAQFNLALKYARGQGVPADPVRAFAWSALAAESGDAGARRNRDHFARALSAARLAAGRRLVEALRDRVDFHLESEER